MTQIAKIKVSALLDEIKNANRVLNSKTQNLAVAESIIMSFKGSNLSIQGTDGVTYFESVATVDAPNNVEFAVKRELLLQTLTAAQQSSSNDELTIVLEGNRVYLQSFNKEGEVIFNSFLFFFGVDDLPQFPDTNLEETLTFETDEIKSILDKVFCYDKAGTREALRGVNVSKVNGELHFSATDGFRLSHVTTSKFDTNIENLNVILYPSMISEVKRLSSKKVTFKFPASRDYVVVESDNRKITFKLIQAQYPEVLRLFPKKHTQVLKTTASNALKAITGVAHISNKNQNHLFKMSIKDKAIAYASNPELGFAEQTFQNSVMGVPGQEFDISLNNNFVKEALSSFDPSDTINLEFEQKFLLITKENDSTFKHLVIGLKEAN